MNQKKIQDWSELFAPGGPARLPRFADIAPFDFTPAFAEAMARHRAEIDTITAETAQPTFENTVLALERAGHLLSDVASAFFTLAGAHTNDELQQVEREVSPLLSRHGSAISLDPRLFARIDDLHARRTDLGLEPQALRLLEKLHRGFLRSGARLEGAARERFADLNARLAELGTRFSQNVLADERAYARPVSAEELAGLPAFLVSAMEDAASERGLAGHVVTLSRSIVVPFLTYYPKRELRAEVFAAWTRRGENKGAHDNRPVIAEILQLRAEKARLLGYPNFASYKLDDTMAKTPEAVRDLLTRVWERARERAVSDAAVLSRLAREDGDNAPFAPADWRFRAEQRRRAEFAIDETALKSYFQLDPMIEASFDVANRLFGLRFEPIPDPQAWHPDVRAWRVLDPDGTERGVFLGDYFARSSKRSGAWMSALRSQSGIDGGERPVIYNVCNFAKPAKGQPALLSVDDARTLFHEFGHALHGLLSDVTYPSLAGTAVSRDFVELPSQLYEHWLMTPEVLGRHARHAETGEPLPQALADKLHAARTFDAGFDTVEFTSSALVDLLLHTDGEAPADPMAREQAILTEIGMPAEMVMRHRSPHFAHIFSGDGYSSGYYSYMWSEVLDADAFEAFEETGDVFDAETAQRLRRNVYAAGNSEDPAVLYERFRGRAPDPDALMRKRGLAA
ncbi:M3 family metallopeptidase [Aureimonas jatrophae]|uniref:Peptidyl-dipeptidase Dcp Metallo peptidase. MEROPS family M03A n=1 Tax=Aureimonas jatrophae TaxID=1166073 RepID=A0A1H0BVT3_9HYPH|nr:M3 family metallopeptidase [Aureimonas jatrophae]MBB3948952.1 peptidyl-dipeptidase Dcp [Aureimonas jatrophae]SDN49703.1 peptidyl-dipeptidase Dcp Metallo peptidase. MEROPS family M03A [Aureimonas jatrophae]